MNQVRDWNTPPPDPVDPVELDDWDEVEFPSDDEVVLLSCCWACESVVLGDVVSNL